MKKTKYFHFTNNSALFVNKFCDVFEQFVHFNNIRLNFDDKQWCFIRENVKINLELT